MNVNNGPTTHLPLTVYVVIEWSPMLLLSEFTMTREKGKSCLKLKIFVFSSSKILWKCIVRLKNSIFRNLLNKRNHPILLATHANSFLSSQTFEQKKLSTSSTSVSALKPLGARSSIFQVGIVVPKSEAKLFDTLLYIVRVFWWPCSELPQAAVTG